MSKVSARPPRKKEEAEQTKNDLIKQFIQHGEVSVESTTIYPWEAEYVRADVIKSFNLRLPESYFLKLEYIAKQTRRSKQSICFPIIQEMIDTTINDMK